MKKGRDVFDAFRESGQQLRITPSGSAWRKVERKLEMQRRRRRIQLYSFTSIAAVIALAVALAAILPLLDNGRQAAYAVNTNPAPQSFEPLTPVSEADEAPIRAVKFRDNTKNPPAPLQKEAAARS